MKKSKSQNIKEFIADILVLGLETMEDLELGARAMEAKKIF